MSGKQQYFRVPWSRLRKTARALYRETLFEMQEAREVISDRRTKRQEVKVRLRTLY